MAVIKDLASIEIRRVLREQQRRRDNLSMAKNSLEDPGSDYGETIQLMMDLCDDMIIAIGGYLSKLEGSDADA